MLFSFSFSLSLARSLSVSTFLYLGHAHQHIQWFFFVNESFESVRILVVSAVNALVSCHRLFLSFFPCYVYDVRNVIMNQSINGIAFGNGVNNLLRISIDQHDDHDNDDDGDGHTAPMRL